MIHCLLMASTNIALEDGTFEYRPHVFHHADSVVRCRGAELLMDPLLDLIGQVTTNTDIRKQETMIAF